jgi:hypothetical protein
MRITAGLVLEPDEAREWPNSLAKFITASPTAGYSRLMDNIIIYGVDMSRWKVDHICHQIVVVEYV